MQIYKLKKILFLTHSMIDLFVSKRKLLSLLNWLDYLRLQIYAKCSTLDCRCVLRLEICESCANVPLGWEMKRIRMLVPVCQARVWMAICQRIAEPAILGWQMHSLFATCNDKRIHRGNSTVKFRWKNPVWCVPWSSHLWKWRDLFLIRCFIFTNEVSK